MKKIISILVLALLTVNGTAQSKFLNFQKKHERVTTAIENKEQLIIKKLQERDISLNELNILIVAYKYEKELEVLVKKKTATTYKKLASYPICHSSGDIGPKRKHRDGQVPEGFYYVDRFNPKSSFHLSFGINYPNESDKIKSNASHLGGNIFIHGACVTIGCLPMTDDKIEEIYLYAINAKNNGQEKIPVYIFPFKMTNEKFNKSKNIYKNNTELINFWTNIKTGYDQFQQEKKELNFSINSSGDYVFE